MRALSSSSVVTVAAAASLLAAPAAYATASGDDGVVRIRDAATGEWSQETEPTVCSFLLDASGFAGLPQVGWKIVEMRPSGGRGTVAETGALTLDDEGRGRSEKLSLKDGRYRLVWRFGGEDGDTDRRLFRVDCDGVPEKSAGAGSATPEASADPSASDSADVSDAPSSAAPTAPETAGSTTASAVATSEPSSGPSSGGDLAETGSQVPAGALAAAGASLLGAGTYLLLRRREAGSGRR
jgi:LPXTG-motif cell wall-anchored protein